MSIPSRGAPGLPGRRWQERTPYRPPVTPHPNRMACLCCGSLVPYPIGAWSSPIAGYYGQGVARCPACVAAGCDSSAGRRGPTRPCGATVTLGEVVSRMDDWAIHPGQVTRLWASPQDGAAGPEPVFELQAVAAAALLPGPRPAPYQAITVGVLEDGSLTLAVQDLATRATIQVGQRVQYRSTAQLAVARIGTGVALMLPMGSVSAALAQVLVVIETLHGTAGSSVLWTPLWTEGEHSDFETSVYEEIRDLEDVPAPDASGAMHSRAAHKVAYLGVNPDASRIWQAIRGPQAGPVERLRDLESQVAELFAWAAQVGAGSAPPPVRTLPGLEVPEPDDRACGVTHARALAGYMGLSADAWERAVHNPQPILRAIGRAQGLLDWWIELGRVEAGRAASLQTLLQQSIAAVLAAD